MASSVFGWDLLYKTVEADIKSNQDVLLSLTHFVLIANGFKCIGLGESKFLDGSETKTETLPVGWNTDYALRYVYQGRLYNLKATNLDNGIMVNLVRIDEHNVSLVQLNSPSVLQRTGTLDEMIPSHNELIQLIKKQLIDKATVSKKSKEAFSQTDAEPSRPIPPQAASIGRISVHHVLPHGIPDPLQIGRNDLYPLPGQNPLANQFPPMAPGGGMIFDPFQNPGRAFPGVAPGSVPPGARFDPFRAPDARVPPRMPRNRPDNDELPPPGYDDMFM